MQNMANLGQRPVIPIHATSQQEIPHKYVHCIFPMQCEQQAKQSGFIEITERFLVNHS